MACEGYDYPDDPYILKGSCGLEYHLDAATGSSKYGYQQQQQRQHNSYSAPSSFGNKLITVLIFCGIIYGVYWLLSKLNKPTPGTNGYTQQQCKRIMIIPIYF